MLTLICLILAPQWWSRFQPVLVMGTIKTKSFPKFLPDGSILSVSVSPLDLCPSRGGRALLLRVADPASKSLVFEMGFSASSISWVDFLMKTPVPSSQRRAACIRCFISLCFSEFIPVSFINLSKFILALKMLNQFLLSNLPSVSLSDPLFPLLPQPPESRLHRL